MHCYKISICGPLSVDLGVVINKNVAWNNSSSHPAGYGYVHSTDGQLPNMTRYLLMALRPLLIGHEVQAVGSEVQILNKPPPGCHMLSPLM